MNYIVKNWRALLFPLVLSIVILIDYILEVPLALTLFKITLMSLVHYLYVLRTKYVYNSDIYIYLSDLKNEFEKHHVITPILSRTNFAILSWLSLIGTLSALHFIDFHSPYAVSVWSTLSIVYILLICDVIMEIIRIWTNKANLTKVKVPFSLQQTRGMWQVLSKVGPACVKVAVVVAPTLGLLEIGYPLVSGGPNNLGPLTTYYVNNQLYSDLEYPIKTRFDVMYEHAWHLEEQNIKDGCLDSNSLTKRTFSITKPSQLLKLGLDK